MIDPGSGAPSPRGSPGEPRGSIVGRLAPSPTGSLHVGNVRTFLCAWLSARAQGGRVLLRIEDLDTPRVQEGVVSAIIDDLGWLGFTWDGPVAVQSGRRELYRSGWASLTEKIYPCRCTRGDVARAQSAPHEGDQEPCYPGTCREYRGPAVAWRLRVEPGTVDFVDRFYGPQSIDVGRSVGDFVIGRSPEQPAYQLAVVLDDLEQGVTEVVRGDDLLASTARQILVHRGLGAAPPAYAHVPLVVGTDGKRLAKRFGDAQIARLRARGVPPGRIIGALARWSGLGGGESTPAALIPRWSWDRLPRERVVLTPERLAELG